MYSTRVTHTFKSPTLLRRLTEHKRREAPGSYAVDSCRGLLGIGLCGGLLIVALLGGRRYIDPGSGSFAIQIIIAAVLGGLLTARLWLRHVFWRVFGRWRRSKSDDQPSAEEADR